MNPYRVLIIGAGKIGAFFDTPHSGDVLTHAHAFALHPGFQLLGFVDVDNTRAQQAVAIWGGKIYPDLESAFDDGPIDVVSVSVPDESHYEILMRLSRLPIKLIFTEKPLAATLEQAEMIISTYKENRIPILVNYTRRFVPEIIELKKAIESMKFGEYISGTGYYGKGILHNGSHMIDLVRYYIGNIIASNQVTVLHDYKTIDPSIGAVLTIQNTKPFYLQCVDSKQYTIFEIDLLFERKRLRIQDSGFSIEEYDIYEDKRFKGYFTIAKTNERITSQGKALYFAASNIYNHLTKSEMLNCSLFDAFENMKACAIIQGSYEKKNPPVFT